MINAADASYPVMIDPLFTLVKKLIPESVAAQDNFGVSVSISGDTVVVGVSGSDLGPYIGSAYIFYRDQGGTGNWVEVNKITASDGSAGDYFGRSVSISGDTVMVGAFNNSAYIFYRNHGGTYNWGQVTKIAASDGAAFDWFGSSVSISGDTVVVGAHQDDVNGTDSGSAYVFNVATDVCEGDFDNDTDVDGSDLAIFAADFGRTNCGSAPTCEGDFDGDNDVDGSDLATFAADFGRTDCPMIP